ncbi:uncharacterized protein (TIGR02145 family) [Chryseobacterium defluvii]|uniref:Uncharacterized protein (TIGR02145 family) n=1 Tax=Chryseobacterium defluvii TaxID=160396 RepID=A0A840KHP5_9FLAO|nr:T9SS type A sorting domain-containing protein [Chryseobacterium defluvii]MBB4807020.1 uncharacterized protein (TIGR02145 family) [Chryseobacterium defluvii]
MMKKIGMLTALLSVINISAQQTCSNTDPGNNPGDVGCVTFSYRGQTVAYTTVRGADNKVWLQQNLGSSQVSVSMTDADSYGDLFQWGRWDDGHQLRNSSTSAVPSSNTPDGLAGINSFITGSSPDSWWSSNGSGDQWTAENAGVVTSVNGADPCKAIGQGWRMPSQSDWNVLVGSEGINNPVSAYGSHLKLPAGGYRSGSTGSFTFVGQRGYYWSSDVATTGGKYLYVGTTTANPSSGAPRGQGASVRCIKDLAALGTTDIKLNEPGIYPNPTNGILYFKTNEAIEAIQVNNIAGQEVKTGFSGNRIDMQELPNGVYIVTIVLKNGQIVSKKIIKN